MFTRRLKVNGCVCWMDSKAEPWGTGPFQRRWHHLKIPNTQKEATHYLCAACLTLFLQLIKWRLCLCGCLRIQLKFSPPDSCINIWPDRAIPLTAQAGIHIKSVQLQTMGFSLQLTRKSATFLMFNLWFLNTVCWIFTTYLEINTLQSR